MSSTSNVTLIVEDLQGVAVAEYPLDSGVFVAGRSRECDIVLSSENASRRHARFTLEHGVLSVEDLQSANGTFVNGVRIAEKTPLGDGALVRIGDFSVRVHCPAVADSTRVRRARVRLIGRNLATADQVFSISDAMAVVGRGQDAGITLVDPSVSRVHARLISQPDGHVLVEDLSSANGTFVNGQRVRIWQLSEGDLLRFGNVEFLVEIPSADTAEHLEAARGPIARAMQSLRANLGWVIGVSAVVAGIGMLGAFVFGTGGDHPEDRSQTEWPADAGPGEGRAHRDASTAGETPPRDPLKQARDLFEKADLDGAAREVARVLEERPSDPDARRLSNRIAQERRAREALRAADASKDPILAATALVEIPDDSIFRDDVRSRLKTLLPAIERRQDRACRAGKVAECARLRGLANRARARVSASGP